MLDCDIACHAGLPVGLWLERATERRERAAAIEAHQRAYVLRRHHAGGSLGRKRGALDAFAEPPRLDERCASRLHQPRGGADLRQLARPCRSDARDCLVGRAQTETVAEAFLQRSKQRRPHQLEADAPDGALASDLGEPGIERAVPGPAGVDVRDPRHQLHRGHVARAHRDQEPRLARARQQGHAPAQSRDKIAEPGERRMLGRVAIDQHGLEAVCVHDAVEFA